jgi:hypothetical protein
VVLDEDPAVAIEEDAARRPQRQYAPVIFLRHLPELLVLRDLEHPEPDRQRREGDGDGILHEGQPQRQAAAIVRQQGRRGHWDLNLSSRVIGL